MKLPLRSQEMAFSRLLVRESQISILFFVLKFTCSLNCNVIISTSSCFFFESPLALFLLQVPVKISKFHLLWLWNNPLLDFRQ